MNDLLKYPRTCHIEGSKLQPGDEDMSQVALSRLRGLPLVIEEKLDGANSAVSFDSGGGLRLQSRGHFLSGGFREKHFAMLKTWAASHESALREILGNRFIMYGEWIYAKHTIYYDNLPHWFMEFDIWDREQQIFLDTDRRQAMLAGTPVVSVPVIYRGEAKQVKQLRNLIQPSLYKSEQWRARLVEQAQKQGLSVDLIRQQTDTEDLAEGLYIKHEEQGRVIGRYKFIRASFLQSVITSDSHWLNRPIVPNGLAEGVDIFSHEPGGQS